MQSTEKATDSASLAVYRLREDLIRTHNPVGQDEIMLVTQIAQCWLRMQRAYDAEQRYFQDRDMVEVINTKLEQFKALTRYVTDCERAWRHATEALQKAQRRRRTGVPASPNARPQHDRNDDLSAAASVPTPPSAAVTTEVSAPRRE